MSRPISKARVRLTSQVTASSTTISFQAVDVNRLLTSLSQASFGTYGYLTINPSGKIGNYAIVRFESWSVSGDTITIGTLTWMTFQGDDASGTLVEFPAGTIAVISNNHHLWNNVVRTEDAQSIAGVKTFSALPRTTAGNPVDDTDLARKAYVDATATGSTNVNRVVIAATAGENISDGDLVYLLEADNEWYKCDADTASTIEGVLLGVAQGSGTNGNAIASGVLISGLDDAQSGLTPGDTYYASNTAGDISATPGTTRRAIGIAKSATELIVYPFFENLPTYLQKALLAGITASAAELNVLDGYTGDTNDLNEMEAFFGATNLTGAEAETLSSGATSDADALHTHKKSKRILITDSVTVAATNVETSIFSTTIPAGTLNTGNAVRVKLFINNFTLASTGSDDLIQIRVKYGGSTIYNYDKENTGGSAVTDYIGELDFVLFGDGATNAQAIQTKIRVSQKNTTGTIDTSLGTFWEEQELTTGVAIDSTADQTLQVTLQFESNSATNTVTIGGIIVEAIMS